MRRRIFEQWRAVTPLLFMFALAVFAGLPQTAQAGETVRIAWDPNPEPNIAGYRVYYGAVGSGLTNSVDVGVSTSGMVTDLALSTEYFLFVTAYNHFGLESDPSAVLYHTTPAPEPPGIDLDSKILAVAPAQFHLPAALTGGGNASPEVRWEQTVGPGVAMTDADTISPFVSFDTPGEYEFRVVVDDGTVPLEAKMSVTVVAKPGALNPEVGPLKIHVMVLPDGVTLYYWRSREGAKYHIGMKEHFGLRHWNLVARDIRSFGNSNTYWIDENGGQLMSGFFSVFEAP